MRSVEQFRWAWDAFVGPEYNCSSVHGPDLEGEQQLIFGIWSITFGTICECMYVPVVYALLKEIRHMCYKIMLYLAIVDVIAIFCNSVAFGVLLLEGAVFCTSPLFIWAIGSVGLGMWCAACIGCLMLVCNRLFEIVNLHQKIEGRPMVVALIIAILYAFYFTILSPPILFNSVHGAMFFDPFIGLSSEVDYVSWPHTLNNLLIVLSSSILYIALCFVLVAKQGIMSTAQGRARLAANKPIFVQATLICLFSVFASLIYVYMNYFPSPTWFVQVGHVCWQFSHGAPPFIYIWLNGTVRRHCRTLLGKTLLGKKISNVRRNISVSISAPSSFFPSTNSSGIRSNPRYIAA